MADNPWANVPFSDPNTRVYQVGDFAKSDPGEVVPTPIYRGKELSSVVFSLLPGQEHAPHTHESVTHAWIVLEGKGECLMEDGRVEPIRPGSVCIHPRTRPHGVRNTGQSTLVYVTVSVETTE